jgi:hypothetical protein
MGDENEGGVMPTEAEWGTARELAGEWAAPGCVSQTATAIAEAMAAARRGLEADRDRLKAALEMLAQCRHVSGSAQGAFRTNLRITDAVLAGADVRAAATVEAILFGTWTKENRP